MHRPNKDTPVPCLIYKQVSHLGLAQRIIEISRKRLREGPSPGAIVNDFTRGDSCFYKPLCFVEDSDPSNPWNP